MTERVTFDGGDVVLASDAAGPPDGRPVVFLHGGGQTRHSWGQAIVSAAAVGYRAYAVDLRGHGESGWSPDGSYVIERLTADVIHIARALPRPPVLVGASLGGIMSLLALDEAPGIAAGLILVDIAVKPEVAGREKIAGFMRAQPDGFTSLQEASDTIAAFLPHRKRPTSLDGLRKNLRERDGRWFWHWDPAMMGSLNAADQSTDRRLEKAARGLRIPTLLLRGSLSEIVTQEGAQHFRTLVPQAEYVDVANADHMIAGDSNDRFNEAVLDFLRRHWPVTSAAPAAR